MSLARLIDMGHNVFLRNSPVLAWQHLDEVGFGLLKMFYC